MAVTISASEEGFGEMTVARLMACFAVVLFWLAGCSPGETQIEAPVPVQASSPQDLFAQRCVSCHDGSVLRRVTQRRWPLVRVAAQLG